MLDLLVTLLVGIVFLTVCLWVAMKVTGVKGTFVAMLGTATVACLLSLIPFVGPLLGIIAMFMLVCHLTDAEFWPHAVMLVLVSKVVAVVIGLGIGALLA